MVRDTPFNFLRISLLLLSRMINDLDVNNKKRKMAERELRRRIKELERERRILTSMEQTARGKLLFAASSQTIQKGTESEEEIWKGMLEREADKT